MVNSDYKVDFKQEHSLVEKRITSLELELKECNHT